MLRKFFKSFSRPRANLQTPFIEVATTLEDVMAEVARSRTTDIRPLLSKLLDHDADAAREAAMALGQSKNIDAVNPLCDVLRNAQGYFHSAVRLAAAHSLGKLQFASAVPTLIIALRDSMAEISAACSIALGEIQDPRAIPPLQLVADNADRYYLPLASSAAREALAKFEPRPVANS